MTIPRGIMIVADARSIQASTWTVRRFASIFVHPADFGQYADVTIQDTPHRDYALRLLIENQELELQTQDNRTWTPAQRPYVPCFPTTHTN
jgi:hypothetical protein